MSDLERLSWIARELSPEAEAVLAKELSDQVDALIDQADRMVIGRWRLLDRLPSLQEVDLSRYQVELMKASYTGSGSYLLSELHTIVRVDLKEIYAVLFNDKSYPALGVEEGFKVLRHKRPETYDNVFSLYTREDEWQEVSPENPEFMTIIGASLHGSMLQLTQTQGSLNLHRCLRYIVPQESLF